MASKETEISKHTRQLVNRPMVEWDRRTLSIAKVADLMAIDDQAAAVAVRYARLSAYIARRRSGGTHADAVKAQNQAAARVRQALGYTYKEAPINF